MTICQPTQTPWQACGRSAWLPSGTCLRRFSIGLMLTLSLLGGEVRAAVANGYLVTWVKEQQALIRIKPDEFPFNRIGWVPRLAEAYELAEKHRRLVFLFTLDGHMETGRC